MFGRYSQASQLRPYSKEPEGPPEVPLVEAQADEGQEIGADDFTGRQGNAANVAIKYMYMNLE